MFECIGCFLLGAAVLVYSLSAELQRIWLLQLPCRHHALLPGFRQW